MKPSDPRISDTGGTGVPYRFALELLKKWCAIVCPGKDVALHSLHRGMATEMSNLGISLLDIQKAGDWQSLCVLRYLSSSLNRRLDIKKLVSNSLSHLLY